MNDNTFKKLFAVSILSAAMAACGGGSGGGSSDPGTPGDNTGGTDTGNNTGGNDGGNTGGNDGGSTGGTAGSVEGRLAYATTLADTAKGTTHVLNLLDRTSGVTAEVARGVLYAGTVYSSAMPQLVEHVSENRIDMNLAPWIWFVDDAMRLKLLDVAKGTVKTLTPDRPFTTLCDMDTAATYAIVKFSDDGCRATWKLELVDGKPRRLSAWTDEEYIEKLHVWTASRQHVGKFTFIHEGGALQYRTDAGAMVNGVLPAFDYINLLAGYDLGATVQFWAETEHGNGELAFRRYALNKATGAVTELEKVVYTDTSTYATAYGPRVVFKHVNDAVLSPIRSLMYDDLSDAAPRISQLASKSLSSPVASMTGRIAIVIDDKALVLDMTRAATGTTPAIAGLTEASFDVPGYSQSTPSGRVFHVLHDGGNSLTRIDLSSLTSVRLPNTRPLITAGTYFSAEFANGELASAGFEESDWFYVTNVTQTGIVANGYQGGTVAWFNPETSTLVGFDTVQSRLFKRGSGNTTGRLVMEKATLRDNDPVTADHGLFWIDADARTWHETGTAGEVTILSPGTLLHPR